MILFARDLAGRPAGDEPCKPGRFPMHAMTLVGLDVHARQTHAAVLGVLDTTQRARSPGVSGYARRMTQVPSLRCVEYALALLLLAVVVALVVLRPLVAGESDLEVDEVKRAELEAAKEAKYREIRDAELDREMGKLSPQDHRAVDHELRDEAIEILRRLDALGEPPGASR